MNIFPDNLPVLAPLKLEFLGTMFQGRPGKSAYDVATDNGFVGSEQEWLDFLKAPLTEDDLGLVISVARSSGAEGGAAAVEGIVDNKVDKGFDLIPNSLSILGDFELKTLGVDNVPSQGIYFGTGGISLSFNTLISDPSHTTTDGDDQRAQLLLVAETQDDGNSEEQTLCILTTIKTGYSRPYAPSTAYSVGDNITLAAKNAVYRCIQAGITAPSGTGPSGTGDSIVDGTVVWKWINDAAINAKLGFYNETVVQVGAGSCWSQVNNFHMEAGFNANFACATEIDLTNHTGYDSTIGSYDRIGLWIACQGTSRSTVGLQVSSANTENEALIWGAYFVGSKLASNSVIGIDASSAIGIGFGTGAGGVLTPTFTTAVIRDKSISPQGLSLAGTYSIAAINIPTGAVTPCALSIAGVRTAASIYDAATTPTGLMLAGTYSQAAVDITGSAPAGISIFGTKAVAGIVDASQAPFGLQLKGTYTAHQISGNNFSVNPEGIVTVQGLVFGFPPGDYPDDAAAAAGGISLYGVYRSGSSFKIRVS